MDQQTLREFAEKINITAVYVLETVTESHQWLKPESLLTFPSAETLLSLVKDNQPWRGKELIAALKKYLEDDPVRKKADDEE
jgi:hypothetical protein